MGRPCAKLTVPSRGSKTHWWRAAARPGSFPSSSASTSCCGKALRDDGAAHPFDLDVDGGDEVDRALLADVEIAAETVELDLAGAPHDLDGGGQPRGRVRHVRQAGESAPFRGADP